LLISFFNPKGENIAAPQPRMEEKDGFKIRQQQPGIQKNIFNFSLVVQSVKT